MCFLSSLRLLNMLIIAAERARMRSVRHFHLTTTGTVRKRSRLEKHMSDQSEQQRPLTTTDAGSPAPSDDTSLTVGANGPVLLQDAYLIEKRRNNGVRLPTLLRKAALVHWVTSAVTSK